MTDPTDRRSQKRLVTRQAISNAATRLFWERGFDAVTVDEIAAAAGVGRMTVFNYFPRKEDLFFDRYEEGRALLDDVLRHREPNVSALETLRRFAHQLVAERAPYVNFSAESQSFVRTISQSETLKARARAIRDELAAVVAVALAESVGRGASDTDAHLAASLVLATWGVALIEAHRAFRAHPDVDAANALFLVLIDRGMAGLHAAMTGTPYV